MGEINFFPDDLEINDQKIILRLDLNVPIKDKVIKDDTRITLCLPFINRLIEKKAKIIIISHLGRPKGINVPDLSLIPIYKYLKDALKTNVYFFRGTFDGETKKKFSHLKGGEVILIENIRFFKEETEDGQDFSKKLGELGDIYINDAFSCSHRKQASVHSITKFVKKSYAGPLLKKEITAIDLVIKNKKEPVTCIIGGSKISTKINVITNLLKKVNNLIIVGAMANNFFVYKNLKVGKSLIENNTKEIIEDIKLYGELHRFLPVLANIEGARIKEIKVNHRSRQYGSSKYGIDRTFRVLMDLLTVWFMTKFLTRPMSGFGFVGIISIFFSLAMSSYLIVLKIMGADIGNRPLLLFSLILGIAGVQLFSFGLLSELLIRTYHESQSRPIYRIRSINSAKQN